MLRGVEYAMPRGAACSYVMGVDLATSNSKLADNAVITVVKLVELADGGYNKKVVYIRSYHGKRLDALADEVRRTYIRFQGIVKIVFDFRGLGDAFPQFLSQPWTDPETGREYPPWVLDDEPTMIHNAVAILHGVKGNPQINQQMATSLRVALEQRSIEWPVNFREIASGNITVDDIDEESESASKNCKLTPQEKSIYLEADALQVECGNVVMKVSANGNYLYETAKSTQRKDRYSSLAMAMMYISVMEENRRKRMMMYGGNLLIGVVSSL